MFAISDYTILLKFSINRLALETLLVSTLNSAHPLHLLRIAPPLLIAPNQRAYLDLILGKLAGKAILPEPNRLVVSALIYMGHYGPLALQDLCLLTHQQAHMSRVRTDLDYVRLSVRDPCYVHTVYEALRFRGAVNPTLMGF